MLLAGLLPETSPLTTPITSNKEISVKKIEQFLDKALREANEPEDPNATKPGKMVSQPQIQQPINVMAKAKERVDAALSIFSDVLEKQAGYISEIFGTLNGPPTKIPDDWKAAIVSTGLRINGGYVPNVGFANPHLAEGKITFVKAGASARGTDTSYLGQPTLGSVPDTQTTATAAPGQEAPSAAMQASLDSKYDTSRYNEQALLNGAKLLNYAVRRSIKIVMDFAQGNLPKNVQPDTVVSLIGPMFNNLLAYHYKNKSEHLDTGVTTQSFVKFMVDANPQEFGSAGLGQKAASGAMPLMFANAIAAYLPQKGHEKQVQSLRMFTPAINFTAQTTQQDPKSQATMVVPAPRGWPQQSRMYISFPFLQSSFYELFQKVLRLGAKTPVERAAADYKKGEGVQSYVRRAYPMLIALGKEHGLSRGPGGNWAPKAGVEQQINKLKAERAPTRPFGNEFGGNATTQPRNTIQEQEQGQEIPGFENAVHMALVTMDALYKRIRKEKFVQVGFSSFIGSILDTGTSSFLQESNQNKKTAKDLLLAKTKEKNKLK